MPTLEEARNELKAKGHRQTDLIISMTGLDQRLLESVPAASVRMDEHKAALLAREQAPRPAGNGKSRFLTVSEEIAEAIRYHGEDARKILEKIPEEHKGGVALAIRATTPEATRQALELGVPPEQVGAYAQFIAAKGIGEMRKEIAGKHYSFAREFEGKPYQVPGRGIKGFDAFPARLSAAPSVLDDKGHVTMALFPAGGSLREIADSGKVLGSHIKGALAFAEFHVEGDRMIITNIQSDLHTAGLPPRLLKGYVNWHKMLLAGLRDYAIENGVKEILLTTAEQQMRRWKGLSPSTAFDAYGRPPLDLGFKLRETQPIDVDGVKSSLFWVHEVKGTPVFRRPSSRRIE